VTNNEMCNFIIMGCEKMRHGRVYWITGLSGSGKTTLGVALYYKLREKHENVLILDGDMLKLFVGDKVGYSKVERLQRAKKYSTICKMLADQGMYVIICTIAMYDEVRRWNRKNINGYIEIFLDVPLEILKKRNKKGLYALSTDMKYEVVGLDNDVQYPKTPDIILVTDGSISVNECVEKIESLEPKMVGDFDRDSTYWNEYYKKNIELKPSQFAEFMISKINSEFPKDKTPEILEIGCGNGRDSLFFLKHGCNVTGIDASKYAIDELRKKTQAYKKAIFLCDDFVKCRVVYQSQYDYIYSRFTLHAINDQQQDELFSNIASAMKPGSKLYIEARTIHDDLYGQGKKISKNEYINNNHYRRFLDKEEIASKLIGLGLELEYLAENRGFSRSQDSDPVLMRAVAVFPIVDKV